LAPDLPDPDLGSAFFEGCLGRRQATELFSSQPDGLGLVRKVADDLLEGLLGLREPQLLVAQADMELGLGRDLTLPREPLDSFSTVVEPYKKPALIKSATYA